MIFGLDKSGICRGVTFRVAETYSAETLAYLWEREMITHVHLPRWPNGKLADGRKRLCWLLLEIPTMSNMSDD